MKQNEPQAKSCNPPRHSPAWSANASLCGIVNNHKSYSSIEVSNKMKLDTSSIISLQIVLVLYFKLIEENFFIFGGAEFQILASWNLIFLCDLSVLYGYTNYIEITTNVLIECVLLQLG